MTKIECGKCEKLMEEAIRKAKQADDEYKEADKHYANMDDVRQKIAQRKADQHYGEAVGINQVLVTLGFKHTRMKQLSELL